MQWRYRTFVIEFQKNGLLGGKYIDEQEVESVLNQEGRQGWELTTATMMPEGLLLCCKQGILPGQELAGLELDDDHHTAAKEKKPEENGNPIGEIKIL